MNHPRRKRWLIDFEVQTSLLRKIACHWFLFLLANALAMFFWIRLFESPDVSWTTVSQKFVTAYFPMILVSIALLPVFLLDTMKLSNRFSGPILRVRQAIAAASSGEKVEPLHFRNGDFWQSLASDFNRLFCGANVLIDPSKTPHSDRATNTKPYPES